MDWMKKRAMEPSTWAGAGVVFTALASIPGKFGAAFGALAGAAGSVAVFLKETGNG